MNRSSRKTLPHLLSLVLGLLFFQDSAFAQALRNGIIYRIEPLCAPGKALEVIGSAPAVVRTWTATGIPTNQQWKALSFNGNWKFEPQHAIGKRLQVPGTSSGTDVTLADTNTSLAQQWKVISNSDGTISLEPANATGVRLDVTGGTSADGLIVQIYNTNTSAAQKYKFFPLKPDATTTGVPPGTTLTTVTGNITATAGMTYTAKDFKGFVTVETANVTFRNCKFQGGTSYTAGTALVKSTHANVSNLVIEDCTFVAQTPSYYANGIIGHDFTLRRCNIYHVVDGVNIHNGANAVNVVMESNYIHDLSFFSPCPYQNDDKTHNDCIQIMGGSNIKISGNNFQGFVSTSVGNPGMAPAGRQANAVFMIKPDVSQISDMHIMRNWMDGGMFTINIANDTDTNHTVILGDIGEISYNRFGRNQYHATYTISMPSNVTCDTDLNVYDDNGAAITVRHNG